jgi:hypothetical protein
MTEFAEMLECLKRIEHRLANIEANIKRFVVEIAKAADIDVEWAEPENHAQCQKDQV